ADGAIDWMAKEQIFLNHRPGSGDLLAIRDEDGAVGGGRLAGGHQSRLHGDLARFVVLLAGLDEAHAATGHNRQPGVPTIVRHLEAGALGRLNAVQAFLFADGDFDSVDGYGWHYSLLAGSKLAPGDVRDG